MMNEQPGYAPVSYPPITPRARRLRSGRAAPAGRPMPPSRVSNAYRATTAMLGGYAAHGVTVAAALTMMLAIRLTEIIPFVAIIRPVILSTLICGFYLFTRTQPAIITRTFRDPVLIGVTVYGLIAVAGVPFALVRSIAFNNLTAMLFGVILVASIVMVQPTIKALNRLTMLCVAGATIVSFAWIRIGAGEGGRLSSGDGGGGSYDPNDLAAMMCLFLPLAIGMILRGSKWHRLLGLTASITFIAMILLTSSRGGLIGAGVILLSFLLTMRPARAVTTVALAIPLLVGTWFAAPQDFRNRAATLTSVEDDYNMTLETGRVAIWKRGFSHFLSRPILGVGLANYSVAEGNFFESKNVIAAYLTAHNTYVQVFVELGFFGGCTLLFLIGGAVRGAFQAAKTTINGRTNPCYRPEYFAAMMGYFTAIFFLSHGYVQLLFAAIGFGAFVRNVQRVAMVRASTRA